MSKPINCDNFLGDKPSTRVSPGASAASGSAAGRREKKKTVAPVRTTNSLSRPPTPQFPQVHAPAGGRSSLDLFGGFAEAEARSAALPARSSRRAGAAPIGRRAEAAPARAAAPVASAAPRSSAPFATTYGEAAPARREAPVSSAPARREFVAPAAAPAAAAAATTSYAPRPAYGTSANVFASGSNQNCGNFITDRPTSRVLSAPGGRSSIVLG